jgi:hypothetical protein
MTCAIIMAFRLLLDCWLLSIRELASATSGANEYAGADEFFSRTVLTELLSAQSVRF